MCCNVMAVKLDHTGDVGCDVAHGGHSSGGEVSCPFLEEVVSKYAQQYFYSDGVTCALVDIICLAKDAAVFSNADVVPIQWGREREKGDNDNGRGLSCSTESRLGNKRVDGRDSLGFGCNLL